MTYGIGILGSGFMGRTWAEVASKYSNESNLIAVHGGQRASALAVDYGCALEPTAEALFEREDVQIVVLATPPSLHAELTAKAARAGKHVLVEKPMAQSVNECQQMVEDCARGDVILAVVSQHRFRAVPAAAKKLIDEGKIGRPVMIEARGPEVGWWDVTKTRDVWKLDPTQQTAYASWGAHCCDLMRWYLGSEAILAFSQFAQYSAEPPPGRSVMATYRFQNQSLAHTWMSYDIPQPGLGSALQMLIVGTEGMIDLDSYSHLRIGTGGSWEQIITQEPFDAANPVSAGRLAAYALEFCDLIDAIAHHREPLVNGIDGLHTTAMLEAAELSARTNHSVAIDPGSGLSKALAKHTIDAIE